MFILLGKAVIGKSTFGNLLIGGEYNSFKAGSEFRSYTLTTDVQSAVTTLSPQTLSGMGYRDIETKNIKVIDQPGMDDADIELPTHCNNLVKCLEELDAKTFATFLIVVNLKSDRFSDDSCLLLTLLSEMLLQASYPLFSKAIIVFTHADEVVRDVNDREELMQILKRKIRELEGWREMGEILLAVNERCIFVNGTSRDENYRSQVLKQLFDISICTLTLRFHGNNDFTSEYLQNKMGIRGGGIVKGEFYNLDYQFHRDRNLFWRDEYRGNSLETEVRDTLQTMIGFGEGVSAMVVLISLVNTLSAQMEELILNLPGCYIPEDEIEITVNNWWKQTCIVFKVPNERNAKLFVETNIGGNPRIKSLVEKVSHVWTWVAEDTRVDTCRKRMTEVCLAVRKKAAGRSFIKNTVISEIKGKMKAYRESEGQETQVVIFSREFHNIMAQGALNIIESGDSVFVKLGGILFKHTISIRSIRLILKNTRLSEEQIKLFKARYTNPNEKVSIEEVLRFLAN